MDYISYLAILDSNRCCGHVDIQLHMFFVNHSYDCIVCSNHGSYSFKLNAYFTQQDAQLPIVQVIMRTDMQIIDSDRCKGIKLPHEQNHRDTRCVRLHRVEFASVNQLVGRKETGKA